MSTVYNSTIQRLLSVGRGPKILLLDNQTSVMISNLIPHSTFLDHDFFLFDFLTNNERRHISETTCICFIRPESLSLLLKELQNPFYSDYIVIFSNSIPENYLSAIAESDVGNSVRGLYEVYIDLIQQQRNLFTVFTSKDVGMYSKIEIKYVKRVCDGLFSLYKTLGFVPEIRVQSDSESAKYIGTEMSARFCDQETTGGTLLVIDRSSDLISSLVYAWNFQAMISEYLDYENNCVKIGTRNYALDSEIFEKIKFMDINSALSEIRNYSKQKLPHMSRGVIKNLTDTSKKNEISESLLTIYNKIMTECIKNKDLSDLEYSIISNKNIDQEKLKVIKDSSVPYSKRFKILLIYLLKTKFDFTVLEYGKKVPDDFILKYGEFREDLRKFKDMFLSNNAHTCSNFKFKKDVDVKLGFEPHLRQLISSMYKGNLNRFKFPIVKGNGICGKNLIIYVSGGLTYNEYKAVEEYVDEVNKQEEFKLILVTDKMITYNDVFTGLGINV